MKIAFFADSYKPYLSGVTNYIDVLTKELRAFGHKVYIFAPSYPDHIDTDPDVYRFPSIPSGYPKFRLGIPYVNKMPEVDIVHCHSPFQAGQAARYVAWRKNLPLVYSYHTFFTRYVHYAHIIPESFSKWVLASYVRSFCRGASAIVCPSKMAQKVLYRWGIRERVSVIPGGVELFFCPSTPGETKISLRQKYNLPESARVLLYAGRLSVEKNIPFLLNAFERLKDNRTYLVLVGGGPMLKELKQAANKNIILTGEISYPEILQYYCLGDIFLFSSLTETQGLVLAEAKAAGLPIVALFAGGLEGTVRPGIDGYLTPRHLEAFLEKVSILLNDDILRKRMSEEARQDAQERFSSSTVAKKMETLYNSLVARKGGAK